MSAERIVFNTGEPAYAVDRSGRIVAWNDAATEMFGYPESRALHTYCWELFGGRDVFGNQYCGERCPHREMAFNRKPINRCQMKLRLASGKYGDFTISTIAFFDVPGREFLIHLCRPSVRRSGESNPKGKKPNAGVATDILTRRELEVLDNLVEGRSTKEIATMMSISIPTVRNHIEHILHKLHCHSRLEAVAVARRLELV